MYSCRFDGASRPWRGQGRADATILVVGQEVGSWSRFNPLPAPRPGERTGGRRGRQGRACLNPLPAPSPGEGRVWPPRGEVRVGFNPLPAPRPGERRVVLEHPDRGGVSIRSRLQDREKEAARIARETPTEVSIRSRLQGREKASRPR